MIPEEAAKYGVRDGAKGGPLNVTMLGNEDIVPYFLGYLVGQAEYLACDSGPRTMTQRIEQIARAARLMNWTPR